MASAPKELEKLKQKLEQRKADNFKAYEKYVLGNMSKEEYLQIKVTNADAVETLEENLQSLSLEYDKAVENKNQEQSPFLVVFSKHKDLEKLSRPIMEELIEVVNFYDVNHIEVICKFQDEFLELINTYGDSECEIC